MEKFSQPDKFYNLLLLIVATSAAVIVGLVCGVMQGRIQGYKQGFLDGASDALANERITLLKRNRALEQQLTNITNPFAQPTQAVNPFKGGYQNPFKASVNPFTR